MAAIFALDIVQTTKKAPAAQKARCRNEVIDLETFMQLGLHALDHSHDSGI
jgi:hypothetical protein